MPSMCFLVVHVVNMGGMTTELTSKLLQQLRLVGITHKPINRKLSIAFLSRIKVLEREGQIAAVCLLLSAVSRSNGDH